MFSKFPHEMSEKNYMLSVPQMNSAVNINKSIQKYIQEKMSEAHQICHQIQVPFQNRDLKWYSRMAGQS